MLAELTAPLSSADFFRDYWPDKPFWSNGNTERLATLSAMPEIESAEAVFAGARGVNYFKPDGATGTVAAADALTVYRLGLTCFLGCAHIPALMAAAEELAGDLGLPAGAMTVEVFCSDGDSGAPMHSDHDMNFAVLLRGRKRWELAENHHIRNQTALCRPGGQEQPDPRQLELADTLPFPADMPADSLEVEMEPGGVLFLPRGWWHRTKSSGECLQVNFVMNRPMWLSVLLGALSRRLEGDPGWRQYALDAFGEPERREAALARFGALLAELRDSLDGVEPERLASELVEAAGLRRAGPG